MNSYLEINPNNIDGVLPGVKLCLLYETNKEHYLRVLVPTNNQNNNSINVIQFLKPGITIKVVFYSEDHPVSDNTAALIIFTDENEYWFYSIF